MQPGDVRDFEGEKALVAAFGIWAARGEDGWLHIHMTGDNKNFKHITVPALTKWPSFALNRWPYGL